MNWYRLAGLMLAALAFTASTILVIDVANEVADIMCHNDPLERIADE